MENIPTTTLLKRVLCLDALRHLRKLDVGSVSTSRNHCVLLSITNIVPPNIHVLPNKSSINAPTNCVVLSIRSIDAPKILSIATVMLSRAQ